MAPWACREEREHRGHGHDGGDGDGSARSAVVNGRRAATSAARSDGQRSSAALEPCLDGAGDPDAPPVDAGDLGRGSAARRRLASGRCAPSVGFCNTVSRREDRSGKGAPWAPGPVLRGCDCSLVCPRDRPGSIRDNRNLGRTLPDRSDVAQTVGPESRGRNGPKGTGHRSRILVNRTKSRPSGRSRWSRSCRPTRACARPVPGLCRAVPGLRSGPGRAPNRVRAGRIVRPGQPTALGQRAPGTARCSRSWRSG